MEKKYKFIYKNVKGEDFFTLEDKERYESENRELPFLFYNIDEIWNCKSKVIVVLESEELCDYFKTIIPAEERNNITLTTILGGVDRKDIYFSDLYCEFGNRTVVLLGNKKKFKKFKEVLSQVTDYIFEEYIKLPTTV